MPAVIDSPRAFEDYLGSLSSPDAVAAAIADTSETGFAAQVRGYVATMRAEKTVEAAELNAAIRDQAQIVMADLLKDEKASKRLNLNPVDAPRGGGIRPGHGHNPLAVGAPLDKTFDTFGGYVKALWHGAGPQSGAAAEARSKVMAYTEKVPSEGGFLVPEEFRAELLRHSLESAVVRPRARTVSMGSLTLSFPAVDETSRVNGVFGGIVVYRTEEAAALTASNAQFRRVTLTASKQTALANMSNEVIRDTGGAIETYTRELVPEAIAFAEDDDFLNGNGAGEPLGALHPNNLSIITVEEESGQTTDTIVWENVIKMYSRMLPSSLSRAVWLVGPDAFPQLATMGLVVGTGGGPIWLPDGTGAPTMTLLGRPIVVTEKAPGVLGDLGDISLVDFSYYLIGDRQQLEMATSPHVLFSSDQTQARFIQRNDGQPWLVSPLTPKNNGPTLSAFVQLSAR
jgi:HK97 family phage major capsid protein